MPCEVDCEDVWMASPMCFMQCAWRETNQHPLEDVEMATHKLTLKRSLVILPFVGGFCRGVSFEKFIVHIFFVRIYSLSFDFPFSISLVSKR